METIKFIGKIQSAIKEIIDCPLMENEGAPQVLVKIDENYRTAMSGLEVGDKIFLLTWLHKGYRNVLNTKPRNNPNAITKGVFATRSPDRPNPIGIHVTEILSISDNGEISVSKMEVIDGTPLIDIKPYL